MACPSVWGRFESVEVRPSPLGGKEWTCASGLVHLNCLSSSASPRGWTRRPGFAVQQSRCRPLLSALCRLCGSPSDWGQRRSPPPQGAFVSGSVLRTQSHHRWVSRQSREGTVIVHVHSGSWRPTFSPRAVCKVLCDQAQAT